MPAVCAPGPKLLQHPKRPLKIHPNRQKYKAGSVGKVAGRVGFDFPTVRIGATADGRVTVYCDPSLGTSGQKNATDVLAWADQVMQWHDALFGYQGGPVNLVIATDTGTTDGTGGAYHYGCDFASGADLYCSPAFGNSGAVAGLFAAELSECFMGPNDNLGQKQPNPWGCGFSNGEGLSRVCANETCALVGSSGALDALGYGAASSWDTSQDWIDQTEQTDGNYASTGAAMVAIDWLRKNGYPLWKVTQAPCDNLEMCFNALTGQTGFYHTLVDAVNAMPGGVQSDYPFTGGPDPAGAIPGGPLPPPPPPPSPPPPSNNYLDVLADLVVSGQTLPVEVVIMPRILPTGNNHLDVWQLLRDAAALAAAIAAKNLPAIITALAQLLADAGLALTEAHKARLHKRIEAGLAKM